MRAASVTIARSRSSIDSWRAAATAVESVVIEAPLRGKLNNWKYNQLSKRKELNNCDKAPHFPSSGRPLLSAWTADSLMLEHVNCDERIAAICPTGTTILERREHSGEAVRRRCREVAIAAPGEVRPGCTSTTFETPLAIGLVTCG